jgi:hypothetical protein
LKQILKYILLLVLINLLFLIAAYLLISIYSLNLSFRDALVLSPAFSLISIITLIIFFKGQPKEPDSQTLYIIVALSLKFLLEIVFALLWFYIAKKTSLPSVLMFFILYLCLTLFSIGIIIKTLKNKALQNSN